MAGKDKRPASAPCSLHEWQNGDSPTVAADVSAWRSCERKRLRALRDARSGEEKASADLDIAASLDRVITDFVTGSGRAAQQICISVFWPLPREPDLRSWYTKAAARGLQLALPAVAERSAALVFHRWSPGDDLSPDLLGIPASTGPAVIPDLLIVPCNGFDELCYRLGNGGGYYDRTMAAISGKPVLIGVAYEDSRLRSIFPQPHDAPMQAVVTDKTVWKAEPGGR